MVIAKRSFVRRLARLPAVLLFWLCTILFAGLVLLGIRSYWTVDRIMWETHFYLWGHRDGACQGELLTQKGIVELWLNTDNSINMPKPIEEIRAYDTGWQDDLTLEHFDASVHFVSGDPWHGFYFNHDTGWSKSGSGLSLYEATTHTLTLDFPVWIMLVLSGSPASIVFCRRFRRFQRRKAGLCIKCGYDLRASHGKCPECGHHVGTVA